VQVFVTPQHRHHRRVRSKACALRQISSERPLPRRSALRLTSRFSLCYFSAHSLSHGRVQGVLKKLLLRFLPCGLRRVSPPFHLSQVGHSRPDRHSCPLSVTFPGLLQGNHGTVENTNIFQQQESHFYDQLLPITFIACSNTAA